GGRLANSNSAMEKPSLHCRAEGYRLKRTNLRLWNRTDERVRANHKDQPNCCCSDKRRLRQDPLDDASQRPPRRAPDPPQPAHRRTRSFRPARSVRENLCPELLDRTGVDFGQHRLLHLFISGGAAQNDTQGLIYHLLSGKLPLNGDIPCEFQLKTS